MKSKYLLFLWVFALFMSCNDTPEGYIKYLEGYWEIKHVEKDNQLMKEYNVNSNIDYFEVNEETLTGFRKKVAPTLEGKFTVTEHESPFKLEIENNMLIITYTINGISYKERIVSASQDKLVITNDQGLTYVY